MQTTAGFALRQIRTAFEHLIGQMGQMHSDCQIKPSDGNVIQAIDSDDDNLGLQCAPVACRVPERASHASASLYVVFTGMITFRKERDDSRLPTVGYSTDFAYFTARPDGASHVLGGHYDLAPAETAHPRAHMQLRSQAELYPLAQANFHSISGLPLTHNLMTNVLSGARAPTAQMDFLSFMLQVCADHLVDENSSRTIRQRFNALASACAPILGYHAGLAADCDCHRAAHWYPEA